MWWDYRPRYCLLFAFSVVHLTRRAVFLFLTAFFPNYSYFVILWNYCWNCSKCNYGICENNIFLLCQHLLVQSQKWKQQTDIYSELTIKTKRRRWRRSGVLIVKLEQILPTVLVVFFGVFIFNFEHSNASLQLTLTCSKSKIETMLKNINKNIRTTSLASFCFFC